MMAMLVTTKQWWLC